MRPCICNRFTPGSDYSADQCARCWLMYHDKPYRERHGRAIRAIAPAAPVAIPCPSCPGNVRIKTHGDMTVESMRKLLDGPAPDWPVGWEEWEVTQEAHADLLDETCAADWAYPGGYEGRGIVTTGGGPRYFVCVFVTLYILRRHGCALPIEVFHLGPSEMSPYMKHLLLKFGGVTVTDALEIASRLPVAPRHLGGWEAKVFSIIHSRFREVLFLDADQVPYADPSYLFDTAQYQAKGAVLWPDLPNQWGYDITEDAWRTCRLPVPGRSRLPGHYNPTDYLSVDSAQVLIDKSRRWPEIQLANHFCQHAEYYYTSSKTGHGRNLMYGDKSCFNLGFIKTAAHRGQLPASYLEPMPNFEMAPPTRFIGDTRSGGFLQHDFEGRVVFFHKCQPVTKWSLHGDNTQAPGQEYWEYCMEALTTLRNQWDGKVTHDAPEVAGDYILIRPFQGHLPATLGADYRVQGEGFQSDYWIYQDAYGLCIKMGEWAFRKHQNAWLDPRFKVWLTPAPDMKLLDDPVDGIPLWCQVFGANEYHLTHFDPEDVILDIGAHTGIFERTARFHGARKIVCVEPNPTNLELLRQNAAEGTIILPVAAWSHQATLLLDLPDDDRHTGGGTVMGRSQGASVPAVPFAEIIALACDLSPGGRIRLLKLDCEGAEWVLLQEDLSRVDAIAGECHLAYTDLGESGLRDLLVKQGFTVETQQDSDRLGHFWARRS